MPIVNLQREIALFIRKIGRIIKFAVRHGD